MIDTPENPAPLASPSAPESPKSAAQQAKKDRLAEALRANLRRRKEQGRQRADAAKENSSDR